MSGKEETIFMKTSSYIFFAIGATLAVLCAGCHALSPKNDPSRFYTLSSIINEKPGDAVLVKGVSAKTIGVVIPVIPAYLQRPQIVERKAGGEVVIAEYHRWAEPLDEAFLRVLGANLASRLAGTGCRVLIFPKTNSAERHLHITVLAFEPEEGGKVVLSASWTLSSNAKEEKVFHEGKVVLEGVWVPGDYNSLALAMSRLIADFAEQIYSQIKPSN